MNDMTETDASIPTRIALDDDERQRCEVWTRVMGYHRPVASFNIGKKGEHSERRFFPEARASRSCRRAPATGEAFARMRLPAARGDAAAPAPALRIGGFVPFSSTDYPGELAAVVFCQGCPWRCGYCHNPHLLPARGDDEHDLDAILALARAPPRPARRRRVQRRRTDGAGGAGRGDARGRAMGFAVGLHTGGAYPRRLARILPVVDWVGIDVKAPFDDYAASPACPAAARRACEPRRVLACGVAHEVRTTVHPALTPPAALERVARELAARGVERWVLQPFRSTGCANEGVVAAAPAGADARPRAPRPAFRVHSGHRDPRLAERVADDIRSAVRRTGEGHAARLHRRRFHGCHRSREHAGEGGHARRPVARRAARRSRRAGCRCRHRRAQVAQQSGTRSGLDVARSPRLAAPRRRAPDLFQVLLDLRFHRQGQHRTGCRRALRCTRHRLHGGESGVSDQQAHRLPGLPVRGRRAAVRIGHAASSPHAHDRSIARARVARQTHAQVGLVPYPVVRRGATAIRDAFASLAADGITHAVVDAIEDDHLLAIGRAARPRAGHRGVRSLRWGCRRTSVPRDCWRSGPMRRSHPSSRAGRPCSRVRARRRRVPRWPRGRRPTRRSCSTR